MALIILGGGRRLEAQKFDVASVKLGRTEGRRIGGGVARKQNGRIDFQRISPETLVMSAYPQFRDSEIVFPAWFAGSDAYYDVAATAPAGTTDEELTLMLRHLLAERLKLVTHVQTRDADVYVLKQSAQGATLRSAVPASPAPRAMAIPLGDVWRVFARGLSPDGLAGDSQMTIQGLIKAVSPRLSRKLLDQTGLTGTYLIDFSFPRDVDPSTPGLGWRDDELFTVLRKKYGLSVETRRETMTILVVDRMEPTPTPN